MCVAISASPPAEISPPLVGDTPRAPSRDSASETVSEYRPLPCEWQAEEDRELQERLELDRLLAEVQSTYPTMDDALWRGLPYQTLGCIYSSIIELVNFNRGPDAIAICKLGFPRWHH